MIDYKASYENNLKIIEMYKDDIRRISKENKSLYAETLRLKNDISLLKQTPAFSEVSRPLLNSKYIVRDWMTGCVDEYDNYENAKRDYDILFESSDNGKEECDISLYQVLHEFNNVD